MLMSNCNRFLVVSHDLGIEIRSTRPRQAGGNIEVSERLTSASISKWPTAVCMVVGKLSNVISV